MRTLAIGVLTLVSLGCSDDVLSNCLVEETTIEAGVHGVLTSACDVGCDGPTHVLADIVVSAHSPTQPPSNASPPMAQTLSSELGFYQLGLDPGAYSLCYGRSQFVCVALTVGDAVTRWDVVPSPPGGARWQHVPECH